MTTSRPISPAEASIDRPCRGPRPRVAPSDRGWGLRGLVIVVVLLLPPGTEAQSLPPSPTMVPVVGPVGPETSPPGPGTASQPATATPGFPLPPIAGRPTPGVPAGAMPDATAVEAAPPLGPTVRRPPAAISQAEVQPPQAVAPGAQRPERSEGAASPGPRAPRAQPRSLFEDMTQIQSRVEFLRLRLEEEQTGQKIAEARLARLKAEAQTAPSRNAAESLAPPARRVEREPPSPLAPAAPSAEAEPERPAPTPRQPLIVEITGSAGRLKALLRLADGSELPVVAGAVLPDGRIVRAIRTRPQAEVVIGAAGAGAPATHLSFLAGASADAAAGATGRRSAATPSILPAMQPPMRANGQP